MNGDFADFLKILEAYRMKQVTRLLSNEYICDRTGENIIRHETNAEHIYSALKLADYFLEQEKEFSELDRLKVFELLLYHDDIEIEAGDVGLFEEKRAGKEARELAALPILAAKYPKRMRERFLALDREFRENKTKEAQFAHAIDKLDAMIHELQYKGDWEKHGVTETASRKKQLPALAYSPTFTEYYEKLIRHLRKEGYFDFERFA